MYWNGLMQDRSFPYNSTKDAGKDGGIFYCCNGLNDLKALVDKGMEGLTRNFLGVTICSFL